MWGSNALRMRGVGRGVHPQFSKNIEAWTNFGLEWNPLALQDSQAGICGLEAALDCPPTRVWWVCLKPHLYREPPSCSTPAGKPA